MKQAAEVAVCLFGILGVAAALVMMLQDFNRPTSDQAGGGDFVDDDIIDTREPLSLAPPPATLSPAQGRRAKTVGASPAAGGPPSAALLKSVDPARELLLDIATEIDPGWMPTEEAFAEHVDLRVGNVVSLGLGYVRELFGEEEILAWPMYFNALQGDGVVADVIEMPTDEDVRRLWTPETEGLFATALAHWHVASEFNEKAYRLKTRGPAFDAILDLEGAAQFAGDHAWTTIFHQRSSYAHWAFLMRLAERDNR